MANPELGAKQVCPNCQAKFYDLTKRPAVCPKCHHEFDPDEAVKTRRVRGRAPMPEPEAEAEDQVKARGEDDEDEDEDLGTPEIDEIEDPAVEDDEDEDAEPVERVAKKKSPDADLAGFSDEDDLEDDDDEAVPFLEEDDEDFDDADLEGIPEPDED